MTARILTQQAATPHKRKQGRRNVRLIVSILALLSYGHIALIGPLLIVDSPPTQDLSQALEPPGTRHLLRTDELGRDIFSRIVHGGRISYYYNHIGSASVRARHAYWNEHGLSGWFCR